MRAFDPYSGDLFDASPRPGELGCAIEIAATMGEALDRAKHDLGMSRDEVAAKMSIHLGEAFGVSTLNGYCASSHQNREPTLRRAMAFDAAIGNDVLLSLYARKLGGRHIVSADDVAMLEWAKLHHQEREIAERRRALEASLKNRGRKA